MDTFIPPHCPNPKCEHHCPTVGWRFRPFGFFTRKHCLPTRILRYRCLHCLRTFSTQTFQTHYWLHKPHLQPIIFQRIQGCSGLRQIALEHEVSPSTVQLHLSRLGRHSLIFQHRNRPEIKEPLVLDGMETFEYSQYFPFHFNILVGKHSHFFHLFTDSPLRRKGSMREDQKRRRIKLEERLGRPDPKAIEIGVAEVLRLALPKEASVTLHSDEHPAYPKAFKRLPGLKIEHVMTPSKEARRPQNPLFPVNLLDLLIRHNGSNHKRETIAFSKRRQGAIERLAAMQVWRNFMRPFSVRKQGPTPAQRVGAVSSKLTVTQLLIKRLFVTHANLPGTLAGYYWREVKTRALRVNRSHRLKYAF